MTLKALQEMIELNEAGSIIDSFKKGYNDTRSSYNKAKTDKDKAAKDAAKAGDDAAATDTGAEGDQADQGQQQNKPAAAPKSNAPKADSKVKVDPQAIADDVSEFLDEFFTKFPNYGAEGGSEDIIAKYPDKASLHAAFLAFKNIAVRIEQLRVGFNKSLLASKLVTNAQLQKFNQQARVMAGANAPSPPAPLIRFVKNESKFFKRMVRVRGNAQLNDADFKQLLALKIKQTANDRVPDAAQALNMLFGYMTSEFTAHSRVIADAAAALDSEERKSRMSSRTT